jgi:hypothetical protein
LITYWFDLDIKTPLLWAINSLKREVEYGPGAISSVFLITDGCVAEEREIVREACKIAGHVRLITLAIGSYSNWFFLKVIMILWCFAYIVLRCSLN